MFETSQLRAFAESLSDADLAHQCREAQTLLNTFDAARIRRCRGERLQEWLQRTGSIGKAAAIVAAIAGVGFIAAAAAPAVAGAALLATRAARGLTSEALDNAVKQARLAVQTDADYLATYLVLESRLRVLAAEAGRRKQRLAGMSAWNSLKAKARNILSNSPPLDQSAPAPRPSAMGGKPCTCCGQSLNSGTTRCWVCGQFC